MEIKVSNSFLKKSPSDCTKSVATGRNRLLPFLATKRRSRHRSGLDGRHVQLVSHLDVLGRFVEEAQMFGEVTLPGEDARAKLAVKDLRHGGGRVRAVKALLVLLVVAPFAELGPALDAAEREREGVQTEVLFEIFVRRVGLFTDGAFDAAGFDDLLILGAAHFRGRRTVVGGDRGGVGCSVARVVLALGGGRRQIQHVDQLFRQAFHGQYVLELGVNVYPGLGFGHVTGGRFVMAADHGPGRVGGRV